ncbi:hypothetical protein NDU88_002084 [Pleurodeles waltl]|uniref:Uncharacterized protein n=1 Tax=Pleurodeles waltl TaxID=8319 RepID=A0AAV7T1A2_PLEWA|nr:hypothetical protein NDU88_002084 [Pleurodeles waltl]
MDVLMTSYQIVKKAKFTQFSVVSGLQDCLTWAPTKSRKCVGGDMPNRPRTEHAQALTGYSADRRRRH